MGPNPRRTRLSDSSLKVAWYSKDARENLAHKLPSTASDHTANPAVHYTVRSSLRRLYLGTERTGIAALDCTGMPSLISVKLYRDQIAPLLLAGEEPLHAENVQGFVAANRIERRTVDRFAPLPQPIRARLERCDGEIRADTRNALERIIDATEFPTIDLDPLFGSVGHGAIGSAAQTFQAALDKQGIGVLMATNMRLVLVDGDITKPWRRLAAVSRRAITGARSRPHWLQRGRLIVDFADGSLMGFVTGYLFAGAARRLADALTRPPVP